MPVWPILKTSRKISMQFVGRVVGRAAQIRNPSRLPAMTATRATKPGRYADGGWLNRCVSQSKPRAWISRFMRNGTFGTMVLAQCVTSARLKRRFGG